MISFIRKGITSYTFCIKSLSFPGLSWHLLTTSVIPSPSPCSGTRCTGQSGTLTPSTRRTSSRGPTWLWWARLTVSTCRWWCRCTTPSVSRTTPTSAFPSTGTAVTCVCRPRDTGTPPAPVQPTYHYTTTTGPATPQVRQRDTFYLYHLSNKMLRIIYIRSKEMQEFQRFMHLNSLRLLFLEWQSFCFC